MTFKSILPDFQLVSHTIQSLLKITPSFLLTIALMLLYKLMPNTPVKFKYVIIPSILAAAVFHGVQIFYLHFQIKLSSYNAIYGSFAAIPFFMLWLQISWTICLIGARMCYAAQNMEDYVFERSSQRLSRRYRDAICLLLMSRICKRFAAGNSPFSANTLARDTQLPQSLVRLLLEERTRDADTLSPRNGHQPHDNRQGAEPHRLHGHGKSIPKMATEHKGMGHPAQIQKCAQKRIVGRHITH